MRADLNACVVKVWRGGDVGSIVDAAYTTVGAAADGNGKAAGMTWWRIYYSDRVFTSEDGTPFDAPRVDVQVIVQEKDGDHEIVHGRDHFYYEPDRGGWCTSDWFGAIDHLMRASRQCLLFGRQLSDADWRAVYARVREEVGERKHRYAREYPRE